MPKNILSDLNLTEEQWKEMEQRRSQEDAQTLFEAIKAEVDPPAEEKKA